MRFLILKGLSQYGSLRLHMDQLAAALVELGHQVHIADLTQPNGGPDLARQAEDPAGVDCVFSFCGILAQEGGEAFEKIGAVYVSLYIDHPLHHLPKLLPPKGRSIAFFLDTTHLDLIERLAHPGEFAHLGFLPPGANTLAEPVDVSREAYARRDIPILFSGTYRGEPPRTWREVQDEPIRVLMEAVADRMAADAGLSVIQALRAALKSFGRPLDTPLLRMIAPLLTSVQSFAEAYHRDAVLAALGAAGVPIQIWGKGWEPLVARHPSLDHQGEGSFEQTLSLLRRARVVLNINNGFVAGGHERVFAAQAGGAAVFSEKSRWYADQFIEGEDIVLFDPNRLAGVPERLVGLSQDREAGARIAAAGHAATLAGHLWIHRAATIVEAVAAARSEA
jgi:hypothetical protein